MNTLTETSSIVSLIFLRLKKWNRGLSKKFWVSISSFIIQGTKLEKRRKKKKRPGVPLWFIGLRLWHCHSRSSGCCYGTGSIPSLGTSCAMGVALKKKKKKNFLSGLGAYLRDNLCWEISLTTERKCQIYPSQNQDQRED